MNGVIPIWYGLIQCTLGVWFLGLRPTHWSSLIGSSGYCAGMGGAGLSYVHKTILICMSDEDRPDAAFHEKKAKNKKTTNYGGGQKLKMKKALKHMKPLKPSSKKR